MVFFIAWVKEPECGAGERGILDAERVKGETGADGISSPELEGACES